MWQKASKVLGFFVVGVFFFPWLFERNPVKEFGLVVFSLVAFVSVLAVGSRLIDRVFAWANAERTRAREELLAQKWKVDRAILGMCTNYESLLAAANLETAVTGNLLRKEAEEVLRGRENRCRELGYAARRVVGRLGRRAYADSDELDQMCFPKMFPGYHARLYYGEEICLVELIDNTTVILWKGTPVLIEGFAHLSHPDIYIPGEWEHHFEKHRKEVDSAIEREKQAQDERVLADRHRRMGL